ncbi:hypothetical protein ACTXT7_009008, partial [Hymenolepis weldensis]
SADQCCQYRPDKRELCAAYPNALLHAHTPPHAQTQARCRGNDLTHNVRVQNTSP